MLQSDKRILSITVDYYYHFFFFTSAQKFCLVSFGQNIYKKNKKFYFVIEPRTAMLTQASKVQAITGQTNFFFFFFYPFLLEWSEFPLCLFFFFIYKNKNEKQLKKKGLCLRKQVLPPAMSLRHTLCYKNE